MDPMTHADVNSNATRPLIARCRKGAPNVERVGVDDDGRVLYLADLPAGVFALVIYTDDDNFRVEYYRNRADRFDALAGRL